MERIKQLQHQGKTIYFMDFSNLSGMDEIAEIIERSIRHIRSQALGSVLSLTDISNMHFNSEIKELFTEFVKGNKPYVKAGAVTGISGLQSFVYNAIMKVTGRNLKSMKSLDEAKDWIVRNS